MRQTIVTVVAVSVMVTVAVWSAVWWIEFWYVARELCWLICTFQHHMMSSSMGPRLMLSTVFFVGSSWRVFRIWSS